ncbi:hypothetical protein ACWCV9_15145 [Streptomyces sp. NPDC001606]
MSKELATDAAAAATRRARYGALPDRVRFEDMVEEVKTAQTGADASYAPEGSWTYYSCLALDLGL